MNDVIAGTAGGIALTLVGHPLDTASAYSRVPCIADALSMTCSIIPALLCRGPVADAASQCAALQVQCNILNH